MNPAYRSKDTEAEKRQAVRRRWKRFQYQASVSILSQRTKKNFQFGTTPGTAPAFPPGNGTLNVTRKELTMELHDKFIPPFSNDLLVKRKRLRRELLESGGPRRTVPAAGPPAVIPALPPRRAADPSRPAAPGRSTHDVKDMLELFLLHHGIRCTFYESEYAQYWQDAMFPRPARGYRWPPDCPGAARRGTRNCSG